MSTRYNTGNPIESTDVRDMSDNAKNFDEFSLSTNQTFNDRLGVSRKTLSSLISQAEQDIYYAVINAGFQPATFDFVTGGTLIAGDRNKAVFNKSPAGDDNWYAWQGELPKIISPNSTPATSGGFGENAWKPVTNNVVAQTARESIRRTYSDSHLNLVDGSFESGGTLVNQNDVLLSIASGKAYSGPAGHVPAGTDPLIGVFVDRSYESAFTTPYKFGAVGDGIHDDTSAFIEALNSGRPVYVPHGVYRITSRITIPNYTVLFGDGSKSVITTDGSIDVFYFAGTRTNHADGLYIRNIKFKPSVNSNKHLLTGAWFDNVAVTSCFTDGAGLVNTGVPDGVLDHDTYDSITGYDDLSRNIIINGNVVIGFDEGAAPVGIYMRYISNATISNNITNHCGTSGILVWGLDADVARGKGYPGEPRWTGPVTITGNTGYKNIGAHIFCMGARNVSVVGNSGMYSIDVGLDMEGCEDSIVSGNTMNNCVNGNYSQFLYQRNVTYIGNVGESNDAFFTMLGTTYKPERMFLDSHAPADSTSRDIRLINNQFRFNPISETPSDLMRVWINRNDSWVVEGNTFVNCRVDIVGSNHGSAIKNNKFEVTVNPVLNYNLLTLQDNGNLSGKAENPVIISGNEFRTSLTTQGGDYRRAMDLNCESFIGYNYIVENNIAVGFGTSLSFKAGGNGNGRVSIRGNTLSGNVLDYTSGGWTSLNRSFVYWENNRTIDGLPYFISLYGKPKNVSVAGFIENCVQPSTHVHIVNGSTGIAVSGVYNSVTGYTLGAVVTYGGKCYRSLISFPNLGNQPDISPSSWEDLGSDALKVSFYKAGVVDTVPV